MHRCKFSYIENIVLRLTLTFRDDYSYMVSLYVMRFVYFFSFVNIPPQDCTGKVPLKKYL